MVDSVPHEQFIYHLIFMAIDIPGGGDSRPIDLRMPLNQFIGESPRCFRDDLQCPHHRVNCLSVRAKSRKIQSNSKAFDRVDILDDVG
jgi:hypothetical protein